MRNLFEAIDSLECFVEANEVKESKKLGQKHKGLNESEYTLNARKCIDAANLLGRIDLSDIEDAAKIKAQIEKLFDKLIKLAPKLNKKEQKEMEEAAKRKDENKVDDEFIKNTMDFKTHDQMAREAGVEFASPEAHQELSKKAGKVIKTMAANKVNDKK